MKTKLQVLTILTSSVLLNLFLILPSCGDPEIVYYIDKETKSYCYFENGASYIYKDSVTGKIDSLKTSKNWHFSRSLHYATQEIKTAFLDWNDDDTGDISNNWNARKKGDIFIATTIEGVSYAHYSINSDIYATYCSVTESALGIEQIVIIPDLQIGNNIYYNVKKFYAISNNSEYYYFYWAKNVGLIRYEAYDINDSLLKNINLVEYEIL